MYIVNLINPEETIEIHGTEDKLQSGTVVQGINAIDSFNFTMLPSNKGFDKINDSKSIITVCNTNTGNFEFYGRPLYSSSSMDDKGALTKEVICESFLGFFCDSQQAYVAEKNWTVMGLLEHIINSHNSQVEPYKHFVIGEVTVTDPNDTLYIGIQRENTWKVIEEKLLKTLGGEIRFRVEDGVTYLDYLTEIGTTSETKIALSKNMKSITREVDPSSFISRLIPYGNKLGDDTEERLDITSVNNGLNYLEDAQALERYGIKYGIVEFDDVSEASNLMAKGMAYLKENNKIQIKYSISALDLSLLGLEIDAFYVHNYYPIENALLGIYDTARVIKKKIDICEEVKSSFEIGDNFKTLSDMDVQMAKAIENQRKESQSMMKQSLSGYAKSTDLVGFVKESDLASYVVEYNSDGFWTYEKWSNGKAKCVCRIELQDISISTAIDSLYRSEKIFIPSDYMYPFEFVEIPNAICTFYTTNGYSALLWSVDGTTKTTPPSFYLMRPNAATASGYVDLVVEGKWKQKGGGKMDLEHEKRLTQVEERSKSNSHRLDEVEKRQDNLDKLVATVEVLAVKESNVENDVKEIKSDVKSLTNKSGQRWDGLVDKIILTLAAAVVGFLLSKFGLQEGDCMKKEYWKKWAKAAGVRAIKTVAQTFVATIGTATVLGAVDWKMVVSASVLAGVLSIATSITGLPEVKSEVE